MSRPPHILLICGMPASGKTTFGNWLRDTHGYLHLDLELADCLPANRLPPFWSRRIWELDPSALLSFTHHLRFLDRPTVMTCNHILAELSANHVEKHALLCGYSVERVAHDYGIDFILYTYNDGGEIENGVVYLQLKATDTLKTLADDQSISFSVDRTDLEHWLHEPMPVILALYDAQLDIAYWLYLQAYFETRPGFDLSTMGNTVTVHLDRSSIVDEASMRKFAGYRDAVLRQMEGVIRHHA